MKVDPILVGTVVLMTAVVLLAIIALANHLFGGEAGGPPPLPCVCPSCPPPCAPCTGGGEACGVGKACGSGEKCDVSLLAHGAEIAGCCVGSAAVPGAPDCCCR